MSLYNEWIYTTISFIHTVFISYEPVKVSKMDVDHPVYDFMKMHGFVSDTTVTHFCIYSAFVWIPVYIEIAQITEF